MTRTSKSHPLQIAELNTKPGGGRIGITFCPGKRDSGAMTGAWDRNIDIDLDRIAEWEAVAVVTLLENHEINSLGVPGLGEKVRDRHMSWYHLPIRDGSVPSPEWEEKWVNASTELRGILAAGFNILVHCKGGLGRAGTVAARLLVELGHEGPEAIAATRKVRPGALETVEQEQYVLSAGRPDQEIPANGEAAQRDRAIGVLVGLAVGDALGTTLEFSRRDSARRLDDMVGGGPFCLKPGEWTDDTAMALALADSLEACDRLDPRDLADRFVAWRDEGRYSSNGACFDIGITTTRALSRYLSDGNPLAGSTDAQSAGNGSLMRLAPVAIRYWNDPAQRQQAAALQSRTTHGAEEAVDACVGFADLLADAISGKPRETVLGPRSFDGAETVAAILAGGWGGKARHEVQSSGYVIHTLEAAIWCVGRTGNFRDAVLLAANLGDDADTVAAVTGQLAGALYGASSIPGAWLEKIALGGRISSFASRLFDRACAPSRMKADA